MKFDFTSESFKRKFILILFVYNLMIGCSKKIRKNYLKRLLHKKIKKPGLKFNPGLALISLQTTGPWVLLRLCHSVLFLSSVLYPHSAPLYPGVKMGNCKLLWKPDELLTGNQPWTCFPSRMGNNTSSCYFFAIPLLFLWAKKDKLND